MTYANGELKMLFKKNNVLFLVAWGFETVKLGYN
jgi:hypothetical protein